MPDLRGLKIEGTDIDIVFDIEEKCYYENKDPQHGTILGI